MSKVVRRLAELATVKTHALHGDDTGEIDSWFANWIYCFAGEIIALTKTVLLNHKPYAEPYREIIAEIQEYFYSNDPDAPKPIQYLALEATEYCEVEYKTHTGPMAWLWEEKYAELIVEGCLDCIYGCDPNPKMIVHEPYREIGDAVWDAFYGEDNE